MICSSCGVDRKCKQAKCDYCGAKHAFCTLCTGKVERSKEKATEAERKGEESKVLKLASLDCREAAGKLPARGAKKVFEKAKQKNDRAVKVPKRVRCPRVPALPPIIDKTQFGPSDPADIQNNPLKYVHIRANEIWKENPKLFDNTTAGVTIIECGDAKTRSVILTSCVEGPNIHPALDRASKLGEVLVPPDPIVHRIRKEKGTPDSKFIARKASLNPVKAPGIATHSDYTSAELSMSNRDPKYTICSEFPGADLNETHAERRANAYAAAKGCTVIAQAPTIGCCDLCRASLGDPGLAKVPEVRQSSAAYNKYRKQTLRPTSAKMDK